MTTQFKDPLKSQVLNDAYVSKTDDDTKSGQLTMDKVSEGDTVQSVQKAINENYDVNGTSEGDVNAKVYANTNKIANGDDRKQAIEKLDAAVQTNEDDIITNAADIQAIEDDYGQPNGLATLDGSGKVPSSQLPTKLMEYEGDWDASTNSPTLANTDIDVQGTVYRVTVAGTVDFGAGNITFTVGDWVYNNGTIWNKSDEQTLSDTDALPEGSINFYYTEGRFDTSLSGKTSDDLAEGSSNLYTTKDTKANLDALVTKVTGKLYYATDEEIVYYWDGSSFVAVGTGGIPDLAKGSLVTSDGASNGELTVGTDGQVLVADSGETAGIKWETPSSGGGEVGAISSYVSDTIPTGYLLCDGSAISRATYSALYAIIGDAFGEGDGSTTFNLPDLRGRFLRGKDGGAGNDPDAGSRTASGTNGNTGDNIGSLQADQYKSHTHQFGSSNSSFGSGYPEAVDQNNGSPVFYNTSSSGGNETRPKNINVNYMIKY